MWCAAFARGETGTCLPEKVGDSAPPPAPGHFRAIKEVLRLLRMTDRYRSLTPLEPSQSKVTSERNMLKALAARDRSRLLRVFEETHQRIEEGLVGSLFARGL